MNTQNTKIDTSNHLNTLFLCGNVMTGRAIDQVLPHPSQPEIYERYLLDARSYIKLAEDINGPIAKVLSVLAHKLGRCIYFMLKNETVFDESRFLKS